MLTVSVPDYGSWPRLMKKVFKTESRVLFIYLFNYLFIYLFISVFADSSMKIVPCMKCRYPLAACFIYLSMFLFSSYYLFFVSLSFSIGIKFSPGHTRLNFSWRGDSESRRRISVLLLLSKGSLPENIIRSSNVESLTICYI